MMFNSRSRWRFSGNSCSPVESRYKKRSPVGRIERSCEVDEKSFSERSLKLKK